ncbi:MAG: hypothetical protein F6K26_14290 [Moorea sp. SIO2I5]|nr:hypothetical protein [Moorena sp. SIO2I5]
MLIFSFFGLVLWADALLEKPRLFLSKDSAVSRQPSAKAKAKGHAT